jgi:hypothetical protein
MRPASPDAQPDDPRAGFAAPDGDVGRRVESSCVRFTMTETGVDAIAPDLTT